VLEGDAVYGVLRGHEHDPGPSALALRLMWLSLGGEDRLLARAGYHGDPVEWHDT
jgi:hypothetical protein